jgi:hypothetical protein
MWSLSVCYRNLPYRSLQRTNLVKHPSNNNNNDVLSKLWYRRITNQPTAFVQQHLSSPNSIASRSYFNPWVRNSNHNHRLRNDQNRPLQQQQQQQTCNPTVNTTIRYKHLHKHKLNVYLKVIQHDYVSKNDYRILIGNNHV